MTALHLACYEGKVEAARVLIEKGQVSRGWGDFGWGVVQALSDHCRMRQRPLQADTRVRDDDGKTPLEMARERGIEEVVALLEVR